MLVIHNPHHRAHQGRHEMFRGKLVPCHEGPDRLDFVLDELKLRGGHALAEPGAADLGVVRAIHSAPYLDFLAGAWEEWITLAPANAQLDILPSVWPVRGFRHDVVPASFAARVGRFSFDTGTPFTSGTWTAARAGAACAIDAARSITASGGPRAAMALTRPPGHHAGPDFFGGYCFLNNGAIAAQALRDAGVDRVAVLDVDYHHGNGTQTIFEARDDVLTVSIHGDPDTEYPFFLGYADERGMGAGLGHNLNLPLKAGSDAPTWFAALDEALRAVAASGAQALVVPLGVDTFEDDPICTFHLRAADYLRLGERLASAHLPTVFTFEGGYATRAIGVNVANVLEGFGA